MKRPDFFLLAFGLLFMAFFYGNVLRSPNDYMFSHTGDGIKNYFTFAYHIAHNGSSTNFEGMNYPFGESYLYTDCHPVLATALRSIANFFPFVKSHTVGLLNGILLFSVFLTFFCTHLLLLEFKFHRWLSVLFSITIAVLSPQLFRIDGHLALSYSAAIPLSWLLLLKCLQTGRTRAQTIYAVCILMLNNLFWLFMHAYLGVIVLSFLLFILLFHFISTRKKERLRWSRLGLLLALCAPIFLFLLHERAIDLHENRTDNPSGFFLHNAELDDILIPHDRPIRPFLDRLTGNIIKQNWEARGYVGFPNTLLFITGLLAGLVACFSRKVRQTLRKTFDHYWINLSLLASIPALLFALAIPFRQFPELLEFLPILKQFRATGRFVWPFYFGFSVFSAYVFQRLIVALLHRNQIAGICFMGLLFLVAFTEGAMGHHHITRSISSQKNIFLPKHLAPSLQTLMTQINPEEYQAILSFPFFYNGSESFGRPRDEASVTNSLVLSYHTGLPCISTNLTRTSITESKKIVQLLTPGYYNKIIQDDLSDDRPFLVVKTGTDFTAYEEAIIQRAHPIHAAADMEILTLQKSDLFHDNSPEIREWFKADSSLFIHRENYLVSDTCSVFYHDGFEDQSSPLPFEGLGGFTGSKKGKNELAVFAPHTFLKDHDYDISIWMHNGEKDALNLWFRLLIEEYDVQSNQWYRTTIFPEHAEVIDGNWSLIEGSFRVQKPQNPVYIVTRGKENSKANFNADELLIKDKGVQVFKQLDGEHTLFYNNHRIR